MPIDFPSSPAVNDIYTYNGRSWKWNGTAWESFTVSAPRFLPVKDYSGSTIQVSLTFAFLPVKNYSGATVNVTIN